jgi:hypothetical protein
VSTKEVRVREMLRDKEGDECNERKNVREKVNKSKDRKDAACYNNIDLNSIHDDCEKGVTEMRDRKEMEERGRMGPWGGRVLKAGL